MPITDYAHLRPSLIKTHSPENYSKQLKTFFRLSMGCWRYGGHPGLPKIWISAATPWNHYCFSAIRQSYLWKACRSSFGFFFSASLDGCGFTMFENPTQLSAASRFRIRFFLVLEPSLCGSVLEMKQPGCGFAAVCFSVLFPFVHFRFFVPGPKFFCRFTVFVCCP